MKWLIAVGTAVVLPIFMMPIRTHAKAMPTIGVADFDYADTSGEPVDQRADHEKRLRQFAEILRTELAKDKMYRVEPIACGSAICSVDAIGSDRLLEAARSGSARYVVYGGVHKMSTLVEWMKIEMVDLRTKALVASRLLTFRGDTDEAYRRAAHFAVDAVLNTALEPKASH